MGRNAVTEALRSGRTINKVFLADGDTDRALGRLAAMAKESGAVVVRVDRRKLNDMSPTGAHQGIMAAVAAHDYATVDDMLNAAQEKGEAPLLVICDELSDPHNLGAIIRTAECAGAHGVIIPRRRSVGLTAVVGKASAGALEYMPVARVAPLVAPIRALKARGPADPRHRAQRRHVDPEHLARLNVKRALGRTEAEEEARGSLVFGTAADGDTTLTGADLRGPAAIVIGNEGSGMSRLVAESCDLKVSIPLKGHISSLNASTAAAVLLYEAVRHRG